MSETDEGFAQKCRRFIRLWKWQWLLMMLLHWFFGLVAIAAPIAITTGLASADTVKTGLGFAAALSTGVVTFVRPDRYAQGFFAAYNALEIGLARFKYSKVYKGDTDRLIAAFARGAASLARCYPPLFATRTMKTPPPTLGHYRRLRSFQASA
jgi:hypothetical protein